MNHNYEDVLAKFSSRNKNLQVDKWDVIDWCAEAVRQIGNLDYCDLYKDVTVTISNKTTPLPCNFYKLDGVYQGGSLMSTSKFREKTRYIDFDQDYTTVKIDYYGLPVDAEGYPEIANDDVAEFCYWYCMTMIYMDDYLQGNIPSDRYRWIEEQRDRTCNEAGASLKRFNKNRHTHMNMIILNMRRKIYVPKAI
jgi:hypothetical protein